MNSFTREPGEVALFRKRTVMETGQGMSVMSKLKAEPLRGRRKKGPGAWALELGCPHLPSPLHGVFMVPCQMTELTVAALWPWESCSTSLCSCEDLGKPLHLLVVLCLIGGMQIVKAPSSQSHGEV